MNISLLNINELITNQFISNIYDCCMTRSICGYVKIVKWGIMKNSKLRRIVFELKANLKHCKYGLKNKDSFKCS